MPISEKKLQGVAVSSGIAIGSPFFSPVDIAVVPEYQLSSEEVEKEIGHYQKALAKSKKEIFTLKSHCGEEENKEIASILEAHLQILKDPLITQGIEEEIRNAKKNSAYIFSETMGALKNRLQSSSDPIFQERVQDVSDIYRRVLSHLLPSGEKKSVLLESILVVLELTPSIAMEVEDKTWVGFISQQGGISSHAAIIARAKKIPYVTGIEISSLEKTKIFEVIIDGFEGKVILNPEEKTKEKYRKIKERKERNFFSLRKKVHLEAKTLDGKVFSIMANVDNWEELSSIEPYQTEGIGLFRGEYLLFSKKRMLGEKEQIRAYQRLIEGVSPSSPVVIRLFDLGGDKPFLPLHKEEQNPALGCRGIRLLLKYPVFLQTQLRALLRANQRGNIRLLIPMLSEIDEVRKVKFFLKEAEKSLQKEGVPFQKITHLGAMLEVPSAAFLCEEFCKEVDFISIGSNDLTQHVLGIDRTNPFIFSLHNPLHPALIRLIKNIVNSCERQKKKLIFCGEMIAQPFYVPLLIGLGLCAFSLSLPNIPFFKKIVRKVSFAECRKIADKALKIGSSQELLQCVKAGYKKAYFDKLVGSF